MQTVASNLALTNRKNTINVNLMVDSVQGRLGIYAWMISKVPSWPLLASVTSNFTIFPKEVKNTEKYQNNHKIAFFQLI